MHVHVLHTVIARLRNVKIERKNGTITKRERLLAYYARNTGTERELFSDRYCTIVIWLLGRVILNRSPWNSPCSCAYRCLPSSGRVTGVDRTGPRLAAIL